MTEQNEAAPDTQRPIDRLVIWLWSFMWANKLRDWKGRKYKVIKVKGWRTALVENYAGRRLTITPMLRIFGCELG